MGKIVKSKKTDIDTMGGQAVMNGVMMRSRSHYAVAVRGQKGKIITMTEKLSSITDRHKWMKKPFIRGVVYMIEMLIVGIRALSWSSQNSTDEDEEPLTNKEIFFTILTAFGLAIVMFLAVPFILTALIVDKGILFNIVDGIIRAVIFLSYLIGISYLSDIKTLFQYHGAEHKTVYCYEDNKPLTVKNVQKYSTKHPRCGTSFIIIVLILSMIIYSFVITDSWLIIALSRIILLPVIAGVSFEALKWSAKHMDHPLVRPLIRPGIWVQHITTKEPKDDQVEVAIASLQAAIKATPIRKV